MGGRIYPVANEGDALKQYGIDANRVSSFKVLLDSANTKKEIRIGGNFLWAQVASSKTANFNLSFTYEESDAGLLVKEGFAIAGVAFPRVFITNTAQAGEWITLVYAVEAANDIRIENFGAVFTSVDLAKATTLDSGADVSLAATATTIISAANADRRELLVSNLASNTQTFRIGDSGAGAANGTPLPPGGTIILDTTAAVYGYNPGAGAESVAVVEIED